MILLTRRAWILLAAHVAELLAVTSSLHFTLRRRQGFRHVLTDNDAVDSCLPLRHEIRTAAGHLKRAPNTSSQHSVLVGSRLLGVHESLRRDLLLVAHVDVQPRMLSIFKLVASFEVGYSWEHAMLLGELIIHCVLILLKLICNTKTILLLLICIRNSSISLFCFIILVDSIRHLEACLVVKWAVAFTSIVCRLRGLGHRTHCLRLRTRIGGAVIHEPATGSSVLPAWASSFLGIDYARLSLSDSDDANFVWARGIPRIARRQHLD